VAAATIDLMAQTTCMIANTSAVRVWRADVAVDCRCRLRLSPGGPHRSRVGSVPARAALVALASGGRRPR